MARSKKIRVPRTTVLFVVALSRILRGEGLSLEIVGHEHWEFEHIADWEQGPRLTEPAPDAPEKEWHQYGYERSRGPDFEMSCYIGKGEAAAWLPAPDDRRAAQPVEIRARLERIDWVALGYSDQFYWLISVWVRLPSGEVLSGTYSYWNDDGTLIADERKRTPKNPPRKIAFWREEATAP